MPMPIISTTSLLGIQLDQRINPHNRNTRLNRTLQLPHLTHTRLQHTRFNLIYHFPSRQIESVVSVPSPLGEQRGFFVVLAGGAG